MRLFKYRIVKRQCPWVGTVFVIQQKFIMFPFWLDLGRSWVVTKSENFFENIEAARKELRWHEWRQKDEVVK